MKRPSGHKHRAILAAAVGVISSGSNGDLHKDIDKSSLAIQRWTDFHVVHMEVGWFDDPENSSGAVGERTHRRHLL
ncbi:small nuclear ribonucleoprotein E-like [Iris pallida]|uniref:Small nuclear ribonucleoprotein E-like n=1 Tax=Iris pallida TaxID=29817 RepID=A0AAX6EZA1_IRIPA|nr:small nuclear ribonucleoprotein E-like [Iris pallida]